jgi:hypothetical protein
MLGACELEPRPEAEGLLDYAFSGPTPLEAAEMAENRYDANDRYRGTLLLANATFASEPVYLQLFERRVVDEDPSVRTAGARGLANHGEARHVPMLVKALVDDPDPLVRREAARGLQRLHGEEAVGPLLLATKKENEPDRDVRIEAATALGQYPQARVLDRLIGALGDDPQLAVNRAALLSLRTLTGQDFGLSQAEWTNWHQKTADPFADRRPYIYPVFKRGRFFYEYLPFVPQPPNETAAEPAGLPPELRAPTGPENEPEAPRPQEPPAR